MAQECPQLRGKVGMFECRPQCQPSPPDGAVIEVGCSDFDPAARERGLPLPTTPVAVFPYASISSSTRGTRQTNN
jgi:hypothetical protein